MVALVCAHRTYTVEARRTAVRVGDEGVVHRRVFAAPLCGVGTGSLRVFRVVETFANDTPLYGGIVRVVGGETLFHRPCHGTMVDDDVVGILKVKTCHRAVGDVARTEADIAHDDVVPADIHIVAGNADAAAGCRLSENGHVRILKLQFRCEVDGSGDAEKHSARFASVVVTKSPAQCAGNEVVVRTVVEACDIADLAAAATGDIFAIAVGSRECELLCADITEPGKTCCQGEEKKR